jgi:uncharacterized membrane protein YeaQ/YmgE (transglycosylase-associated protein family)
MPLHLTIEKGRPLLRPSLLVYWSQIALLAAALLIGVAQIAELPPFEGFDEIAHYSYIEQMAETGTWPCFDCPLSAEVNEYLQVGPSSLKAGYSYQGFFASAPSVVENGRVAIHSDRDASRGWRPGVGGNWQAQHPPLYYLVMAPFYNTSKSMSLGAQLFFLRSVSYLMAWIGLCLACFSTFSKPQSPLVNASLMLAPALWPYLFPMWFPEMARLGNDSLVILLAACACIALKKLSESDASIIRHGVLGAIFGLGLLTKATFLPFAIVTAGFLAMQVWRARAVSSTLRRRACGLIAFLLTIGAISGWWYLGKYIETGSALGSFDQIVLNHSGGLLNGLRHNGSLRKVFIDWPSFLASSFVWVGTWSFVRWPPISILPLTTMIWLIAAGYLGAARDSVRKSMDCLPALTFAALLFALFNHSLVFIAAYGAVGGSGWYVHSFLPILAPLVGFGLARTVLISETRRVMFVLGLYPLVFLPAMMLTQGLFFAGCDLRPNETSPIDPSLLLGCLGDLSGKVHNLSMLSYPWVAISFFFFGWASLAIGVGGSMYAFWRLVKAHAKVDMSGTNDLAAAISGEWGPRQVLSRLVGPHSAVVVENAAIAVVGALIGSWLLRQWGYFDFGTSGIIRFLIRAFIAAVALLLMAKLVRSRRAAGPGALASAQIAH